MAVSIPRGIQIIKRKLKRGKGQYIKYRVRISRKDCKQDRLFDTLKEAEDFLANSKSPVGKKILFDMRTEEGRETARIMSIINDPKMSTYLAIYKENYLMKEKEADTYLKKRNRKNIEAFYDLIERTKVPCPDPVYERLPENYREAKEQAKQYNAKPFGDFKLLEIDAITINDYIKTRLKTEIRKTGRTVKKSSVAREITFLNRFFQKIRYIAPNLDFKNPIDGYDRDLLRYRTNKRDFRFSDEQMIELMEALDKNKNPEMKNIVMLSLLTAMRRSEILTLTWPQIRDGYIQLIHTKSGKPRKVYLAKEAKDLIESIPKREGDERLFEYSITGFEGSFSKFKSRLSFKFRFHDFRREGISRLVEKAGIENSVLLAEILGFSNVRKLEEGYGEETASISSQRGLLKSIGHANPDTTKNFYYSIKPFKPT